MDPFALRFIRARKMAKLSLLEAAQICDVVPQTIRNWESAKNVPSLDDGCRCMRLVEQRIVYSRFYPLIEKVRQITGHRITVEEAFEIETSITQGR